MPKDLEKNSTNDPEHPSPPAMTQMGINMSVHLKVVTFEPLIVFHLNVILKLVMRKKGKLFGIDVVMKDVLMKQG